MSTVVKQPDNYKEGGITGKGWKKGQSGNPSGRPKGHSTWSEVANDLLDANHLDIKMTLPSGEKKQVRCDIEDGKTIRHAVVSALIVEALKGNVPAIRELCDRTEGKPAQKIETTTRELPQGFVTKRI